MPPGCGASKRIDRIIADHPNRHSHVPSATKIDGTISNSSPANTPGSDSVVLDSKNPGLIVRHTGTHPYTD